MSKPATKPRWATDLTNNTAPSSGQQDTGWTPGQDGTSDYDNWAKYWTYKWIEWLDGLVVPGADARSLWLNSAGELEAGKSTAIVRHIPPSVAVLKTGTVTRHNAGGVTLDTAPSTTFYPVELLTGDTITAWTLFVRKITPNTTAVNARLFKYDSSTDTITAIDANVSNNGNAPGVVSLSQTLSGAYTSAANESVYLQVSTTGADSGDLLGELSLSLIPV